METRIKYLKHLKQFTVKHKSIPRRLDGIFGIFMLNPTTDRIEVLKALSKNISVYKIHILFYVLYQH